MKEKISYKKAYEELQSLIASIQSDEMTDLDEMVKKTKRANELLAFCKERLRTAEEEISNSANNEQ